MRRSQRSLPLAAEPRIAIVGAGAAGLACAAALPPGTVVVDRVPVPGGVLGDRHPGVAELACAARDAGAELLLGRTALRLGPHGLLVAGPGRIEELPVDVLVLAQGQRPRGARRVRARRRPPGRRPARAGGVPPRGTGVPAGRRPLVVGGGDWALRAVELLREHGAEVALVATEDAAAPDGVVVHAGLVPRTIRGGARVEALVCTDADGDAHALPCDALILADGVVAVRNVDGARADDPRVVAVAPPAARSTLSEAVEGGTRRGARRTRRGRLEEASAGGSFGGNGRLRRLGPMLERGSEQTIRSDYGRPLRRTLQTPDDR